MMSLVKKEKKNGWVLPKCRYHHVAANVKYYGPINLSLSVGAHLQRTQSTTDGL